MNCHDFEIELERFLRNTLPLEVRTRCEWHLTECSSCAELVSLARLPVELPESTGALVEGVLRRTSGSACGQAEENLALVADRLIEDGGARELLAAHLAGCASCSGLVADIERQSLELPRLARVQPAASMVADVLRRTLPAAVRVRRWWVGTWPRWVRRPRFASELAYACTLVLVLVFGTPVSPLQAMSERAFEFARQQPLERLQVFRSSTSAEISSKLREVAEDGAEQARGAVVATGETIGTILDEVASWFSDDEESNKERP